jgi:hypothetical protein
VTQHKVTGVTVNGSCDMLIAVFSWREISIKAALTRRIVAAWAANTRKTAVRTGAPANHTVFGLPFWEDLQAHPDVAASFDALMGPLGTAHWTSRCWSTAAGNRCRLWSSSMGERARSKLKSSASGPYHGARWSTYRATS